MNFTAKFDIRVVIMIAAHTQIHELNKLQELTVTKRQSWHSV